MVVGVGVVCCRRPVVGAQLLMKRRMFALMPIGGQEMGFPMRSSKIYTVHTGVGDTLRTVMYHVGQRVQLHPATDAWMSGDKYGEIKRLGGQYVHITMDVSGRVRKIAPHNILGPVA